MTTIWSELRQLILIDGSNQTYRVTGNLVLIFSNSFYRLLLIDSDGGHCFRENKIKDFSIQWSSSTLMAFFQTYFITVFSMWHSFYDIKSVCDTDFHYTAHSSLTTAPFFTQQGSVIILELKHFQGPLMLNSKTFKHQICFQGPSTALKNGKDFSRTFKNEWSPWTVLRSVLRFNTVMSELWLRRWTQPHHLCDRERGTFVGASLVHGSPGCVQ